jgi:hypothetical protein
MACSNIKIPIELKLNGIPETSLNIQDAVCIVAKNASRGVNLVQGQYCTLYKDGGLFDSQMVGHKGCHETDRDYHISPDGKKYNCSYFRGVHETASAKEDIRYPGTEEITNRGGRVSIVMCDRIPTSTVARFKASNKSELIGFYILHVSGHNTGIVHLGTDQYGFDIGGKQDHWFMEPGEMLISHLILNKISLLEFSNSDPEINKCDTEHVQNIQRWIKARFLVN